MLLLTKLRLLGVDGHLLGWIADFLVGRQMRVVVGGCSSPARSVQSGVPQGSVLGPLLFLIFINHISHDIHSFCKLFADDLKLILEIGLSSGEQSVADIRRCQEDINVLYNTAKSWGLHMNFEKCLTMDFSRGARAADIVRCVRFTMGGQPINHEKSGVDLGVTVDTSLRFHQHIAVTVRKAGGLATNLLRSTLNREVSFMVTLFITHVRPILDYCSCLWNTGYIGDLDRLESVQRRWTRHIQGLENMDYASRLRTLNLYSIRGRLLRADLVKCWKIFHGKSCFSPQDLFSFSNDLRTRGHPFKIYVTRPVLDCRRRSFAVRCVGRWNSLPTSVVMAESLSVFKSRLHSSLSAELYKFA